MCQFWFICDASHTNLEVMFSVHCTVAFGFYGILCLPFRFSEGMRECNGNFFIRLKKGGCFQAFSFHFHSFCFVVVLAINVNLCGSENFLLKTLLLPFFFFFG